jgi:hypothetical protein
MDIKLLRPSPKIIHLKFKRKMDLTKTMLRFQEYFESPKFRNKYFSLEEFKAWYITTTVNNTFSYYSDWSGFNFPSKTLKSFYAGKFDPLTQEEKHILDLLRQERGRFYVIATFKSEDVRHETAHAKFYVDARYRNEVKKVISSIDTKPIFKVLKEMGYDKAVWVDESHAYLLEAEEYFEKEFKLKAEDYKDARRELAEIYKRY